MTSVNRDNCIVCSKIVKKCHIDISFKICHGFIHNLNTKKWVCQNCCQEGHIFSNSDLENDIYSLNECSDFDINKVEFQKNDDM